MTRQTKHHPVFELSKITDQIYLGTNLCCTAKPHVEILKEHGISADIDLEEERQEKAPNIEVYLWLPVKDKTAPTQDQLDVGVLVMDRLIKAGKKIYAHCMYGHGRSPTLVAAYFIYKGMGVNEAIEKIRKKRPEIHLEKVQVRGLREFEKRMRKS
jgi:protein-tyrosine phosphatase